MPARSADNYSAGADSDQRLRELGCHAVFFLAFIRRLAIATPSEISVAKASAPNHVNAFGSEFISAAPPTIIRGCRCGESTFMASISCFVLPRLSGVATEIATTSVRKVCKCLTMSRVGDFGPIYVTFHPSASNTSENNLSPRQCSSPSGHNVSAETSRRVPMYLRCKRVSTNSANAVQ
jgi:hypothetical protein